MATLNSIDGTINSAGNNPPLNTDLICTLYRMDFLPTGGSIEYINHTGATRKWSFSKFALSDRICKIISINGVQLTDLGIVFNIPAETVAPKFRIVPLNSPIQAKSFKVYFGTPTKPQGIISYNDELGNPKQLNMLGTTTTIKATRFNNLTNVRIVDLNPEIPDVAPVAAPAFTIAVGTYDTICTPVRANVMRFLNPPEVELISGGTNPVIGEIFAATHYAMNFPEVGTGTIEYEDNNGKYKKYTLNKADVWTDDKKLRDGINKIISLSNVVLEDLGLVYTIQIPENVKFLMPTAMPIKPAKPKFYKVYFGNPVYPQGSIIYFDAKGINKMITNFGRSLVIDAANIYSLQNVRIEELGDVI